jgi:hypothetical protein
MLAEIFHHVNTRMRADFEMARVAQSHHGERGVSVEGIVREFLRKYLPPSLCINMRPLSLAPYLGNLSFGAESEAV